MRGEPLTLVSSCYSLQMPHTVLSQAHLIKEKSFSVKECSNRNTSLHCLQQGMYFSSIKQTQKQILCNQLKEKLKKTYILINVSDLASQKSQSIATQNFPRNSSHRARPSHSVKIYNSASPMQKYISIDLSRPAKTFSSVTELSVSTNQFHRISFVLQFALKFREGR